MHSPFTHRFAQTLSVAVALGGVLTACSSRKKPEADPAKVKALFSTIEKNVPFPGAAPVCTADQLIGGASMTQVSLLKVAEVPSHRSPEREDWINPHELDSPAVRELGDPNVDQTTKRQAAYELLGAPFYVIYRVDLVDAPMALRLKEPKRGMVTLRALRHDKQGNIVCVRPIRVMNTLEVSDDAIVKSNLPTIDPKVAEELRLDLRKNMLLQVAALGRPDSE